MRVLFLLGCNEGPSKRYRVFNHQEYLTEIKVESEWIWDIDARINDDGFLASFTHLIIFRAGYNDRLKLLIDSCRRLSIPIIYDIDDLVFDILELDGIDAYQRMNDAEKRSYEEGVSSINLAINQADYLITSTNYLADKLKVLFRKPIFVIPFGVNQTQIKINELVDNSFESCKFIGYQSGTNSHHKDFQVCAADLARILADYDDVFLKVIGYLDTDSLLPGLEHKIIKIPFMPWEDLIIEVSSFYINIAPFDTESTFCKSKSELKFVESGLSFVPTIASDIPSFSNVIEDGVNGFIAVDGCWYDKLATVIESKQLRDLVGAEANRTVKRNYIPRRLGKELFKVLKEVTKIDVGYKSSSELPSIDRPFIHRGLRISWVIPQPFEASGGHRNIFRAIRYLSRKGHICNLYVLPDNHRFSSGSEVESFIAEQFFDIEADSVVNGVENIEDCDVLVATYWTTAYVVEKNKNKSRLHVYFLQDYEPMFFPMGVDYVRAMETYKLGFYPITSGPWPLQMLKKLHNVKDGTFFRFPLDRKVYFPPAKKDDFKKSVIFFARPDMPRRCYYLGVLALAEFSKRHPEVHIIFYGDKSEKYVDIPFEFINIGMTNTIDDLAELYRKSTVGLCFSTTNPSLVPYEMMACGLPVVDLDINDNDVNYDGRQNCFLVEPNPLAIAHGLSELIINQQLRNNMKERFNDFLDKFPTENEMGEIINNSILSQYEKILN